VSCWEKIVAQPAAQYPLASSDHMSAQLQPAVFELILPGHPTLTCLAFLQDRKKLELRVATFALGLV
jgi:hypothetical protein